MMSDAERAVSEWADRVLEIVQPAIRALQQELAEAKAENERLNEFVTFVRRTAGDQWTDNVLAITAQRPTETEEGTDGQH
jgi:hypothetical protein